MCPAWFRSEVRAFGKYQSGTQKICLQTPSDPPPPPGTLGLVLGNIEVKIQCKGKANF